MLDIEPHREFVVDDAAPPTRTDGSDDPAPAVERNFSQLLAPRWGVQAVAVSIWRG
jgi:hypothetical protein